MRQFVVLAHDVPLDADFSLDDLASGAGRVDLLCRCLNAAFLTSHGIREDVRVYLVVRDAATIRLEGAELRNLHPDERSIAALVRDALVARQDAVGHMEVESSPGVYVSKRGLADVLAAVDAEGTVIQLHEDGTPVVDLAPPAAPTFVLSDHREFTEASTPGATRGTEPTARGRRAVGRSRSRRRPQTSSWTSASAMSVRAVAAPTPATTPSSRSSSV